MAKQMTFGVIVGNRGFFPDHLAKTGRDAPPSSEMLKGAPSVTPAAFA